MKLHSFLGTALVALCLTVGMARADSVVKVTLIDKLGAGDLSKSLGLGMGMKADMKTAKMGININPKSAMHGYVKFDVTNLASNLVHEVLVARVTDENQLLPFDEGRNKLDLDKLQTLGSVSEIDPNRSASLTLDLKPGTYVLFCNIAGHYMAGMWTVVQIK